MDIIPNTSLPFHYFRSTALPSTLVPKVGSKRKGKEPNHKDLPPRFNHSSYHSQEAFDNYSIRTITYCGVVNFKRLGFLGFNQMMSRMQWLHLLDWVILVSDLGQKQS